MAPADLEISSDPTRIDVDLVHAFLNTTYWAAGRSRQVVERAIANSLCFGGYMSGRQVAFGRVVTDYAVFGYLSDIFVIPEFRGQGIGTRLVLAMMEHPDVAELKVVLLRTRDAHELYRPFGFRELPAPEEMMARWPARR
jgi:ribosomal protein S18 acetylase RimI-like enzyme